MATKKRKPVKKVKARSKSKRAPAKKRTPAKQRRPVKKADPLHSSPGLSELEETAPRDEVWEIFRRYDTDGSGFIDRDELAHLCEALGMAIGEDELLVAFDVVDANRSGKISWDEFSAWWRSR